MGGTDAEGADELEPEGCHMLNFLGALIVHALGLSVALWIIRVGTKEALTEPSREVIDPDRKGRDMCFGYLTFVAFTVFIFLTPDQIEEFRIYPEKESARTALVFLELSFFIIFALYLHTKSRWRRVMYDLEIEVGRDGSS